MIYISNAPPIINGYVQIPNSQFKRTRVTVAAAELAVSGATEEHAGQVTKQKILRLPAFDREVGYVVDWYAALNAL